MMKITDEIIRQGESENHGFSQKQLSLLGVEYPPIKGWKKKIIGKEFDEKTVADFASLKNKHLQR